MDLREKAQHKNSAGELLKRIAVIVLAILVGLSFGSSLLIFAIRHSDSFVMAMPVEKRMLVRSLIFLADMAVGAVLFGVTSTVIAPRAGRILILAAAVLGFIPLLPFAFIEGFFFPPLAVVPVAGAAACTALAYLGHLAALRFWPGMEHHDAFGGSQNGTHWTHR
jgi:hypothetical protein